ncbi:MAG: UDP-N-acetylmuramoyl-L-alanyl-D-glutamate--2,6-diaminopimelate ligase [Candidatus Margulisbacteria bacterium]|nr:UDP-N-acetylmuramoyl-L-alanyl-D-glutamate--2,6-diaminopimelate ligase [Candidatus Margulisiibacteriota bacterium]
MEFTGISYDSRKVKPGNVFVAIPGLKVDGTDFIAQAIERGATTIVAEKEVEVPAGIDLQKVPSARRALAHLANKFYDYPSRKLKLIGITGTNGKTTTAYFIESILKAAGHQVGMIGTVGARINGKEIPTVLTTPESLELQALLAQMVEQGVTHVVMEVSSHALALERVAGCDFDIAIFTNLTHDHLDFHKTKEEYLNIKRKLFEMLKADGIAIVNVDDPASHHFISAVKGEVITFGVTQAKHELRSTKHNEFDTNVSDVFIKRGEMALRINSVEIRTSLIGLPNVYNIVAAYQCGLALGVQPNIIKKGIESLKSVPGRFERIDCGQNYSVIVDFAHSPDALQKLIETYRPLTKGKIILVFGCPGDRDKDKRPLMGKLAVKLADFTIVTTDDPHSEKPEKIIEEILQPIKQHGPKIASFVDRRKAINKALAMAEKGDTVLIAGRGHEKYQDFDGLKVAIDDKEAVQEILASYMS